MKIASEELIADLIERTRHNLNEAERFKGLTLRELNWRSWADSWSVLECIEHLNLYGDFYLPEIAQRMSASNYGPSGTFKSGMIGNYFAEGMLPKEKLNKMKTFKDKNPIGSKLDITTLDRFIGQQKKTLELLDKARQKDLTKTKTAISITKLLKLRLGDTFRVVIYHNQRHIVQAGKVLAEQKKTNLVMV
ncbi:DinB family protein [Fulvivirga sp. 29W222]|uniref:DinB family protein n=1 Tax=Fulvivirga marina TaxID=2494733 RepID=A0A937FZL9_9BACT|nr:DinB family protein [Fulvivirga marina]MBL6447777.1 DinB family protein [Fulvivirga marina]